MADIFLIDESYIEKLRKYVASDIGYARYCLEGEWKETEISNAYVQADGVIDVSFVIKPESDERETVTAIELYNSDGTKIGSKDVKIVLQNTAEAVYYACRFNLFQMVRNNSGTWQSTTATYIDVAAANTIKSAIAFTNYQVVNSLPTVGEKGKIYLIESDRTGEDKYDEYVWIGNEYEKIGSVAESIGNTEIEGICT